MSRLEKLLSNPQSRANCDAMIAWIANKQERYDELVELFLAGDKVTTQRAAWPLSEAVISNPEFPVKHLGKLMRKNEQPGNSSGSRKNIMAA